MKMFGILAAATLALIAFAPASQAASFGRYGKLTYTERAICDNPNLSKLDSQMARRYRQVINSVSYGLRRHVQHDQIVWLGSRNACGANVDCIEQAYRYRMSVLNPGGY